MSLKREEARTYLDPDVHRALKAICDARGMTVAQFLEDLVVPEVNRLVHESTVIVDALRNAGISRKKPEKSGEARRSADENS